MAGTLIVKQYDATAPGSFGDATQQLAEPARHKWAMAYAVGGSVSTFDVQGWVQVQAQTGGTDFKIAFGVAPVAGDVAIEFMHPVGPVFTFYVPALSKIFVL